MDQIFGNFIPFEIWNLVLDKLENGSSNSAVDLIYLFEALEDSKVLATFQKLLKDRWQLINLTGCGNWSEILERSPSVRALAGDNLVAEGNPARDGVKRIFIVDEKADVGKMEFEGRKLDLVYCGDNLELGSLVSSLSLEFPGIAVSLVVDCEDCLCSGKNLFGILNTDLFGSRWSFEGLDVSFPWAKTLECNYMALDTFVYQALNCHEWSRNGDLLFQNFLNGFKIHLPMLEEIKFVTQGSTRNETCNFIDLSSLVLNKFKQNKIPLMCLFKIHSLENWRLPRITEFSGHRFKFDETTLTGSPERRTISLSENLNLLREMAISETIDATPYYRLSLLPRGVKHARIVNWVSTRSTPIMILKSKSLESLSLKLLTFDNAPATVVQGLFLPVLQCLNLERMEEQQVVQVRPTFDRRLSNDLVNRPSVAHTEPAVNSMSPIVFSSWNQLSNLHVIRADMKMNHYIFDIENLKKSLPLINLKKSFNTFFDEQQRFIVV